MRKLPSRFDPILFGFVLSGLMSCLVSGIATLRTAGVGGRLHPTVGRRLAYGAGFPIVLLSVPLTLPLIQLQQQSHAD